MALTGKLETETEIKAPADKFFKIFRSQAHHLPNICSDKIHKIEVHEGDWETQGSVKHWSLTVGKAAQTKNHKTLAFSFHCCFFHLSIILLE